MVGEFGLGGPKDVRISRHARQRWQQRTGDVPFAYSELDRFLWDDALPVVAPEADADATRLVEIPRHRDMLLVAKENPGEVVVTTALYADKSRLRRP